MQTEQTPIAQLFAAWLACAAAEARLLEIEAQINRHPGPYRPSSWLLNAVAQLSFCFHSLTIDQAGICGLGPPPSRKLAFSLYTRARTALCGH